MVAWELAVAGKRDRLGLIHRNLPSGENPVDARPAGHRSLEIVVGAYSVARALLRRDPRIDGVDNDTAYVAGTGLSLLFGTTFSVANLGVGTAQLADVGVTTAKLADNAVTTAKLANNTASLAKMTGNTMHKAGNNIDVGMEGQTLRAPLHVAASPSGSEITLSRTAIFDNAGTVSLALRTGSTNAEQHIYFDRPIGQVGLSLTFGGDGLFVLWRRTFTAPNGTSSQRRFTFDVQTGELDVAGNVLANRFAFSSDSDTGLSHPNANTLALLTGGAERLRITSGGLLGVGTNNPAARLHIASAGATPQLHLGQNDSPNAFTRMRLSIGNTNLWDIAAGGNNRVLNFYHIPAGRDRMTLDANGNLFIDGTLNPPSDRNVKQDFTPVDAIAVLEKVAALPVQSWAYKHSAETRHIGPVAQDFHAVFGLGASDTSIATVDADGVALVPGFVLQETPNLSPTN